MKIRTKAPNFALTKELNENTNKSTKSPRRFVQFWQNFQTSLVLLMHQSILALPIPPPGNPRAFALFFCPGAGHWYLQSCPGGGELFTGRAFDSTGRFCDEHVLL